MRLFISVESGLSMKYFLEMEHICLWKVPTVNTLPTFLCNAILSWHWNSIEIPQNAYHDRCGYDIFFQKKVSWGPTLQQWSKPRYQTQFTQVIQRHWSVKFSLRPEQKTSECSGSDQLQEIPIQESFTPTECRWFYSLPINISDAGNYYCGIATSRQILFGNGTALIIGKLLPSCRHTNFVGDVRMCKLSSS